MDTNLLTDDGAGRTIDPPTPEQSLLAHIILGRAAYEAYNAQRGGKAYDGSPIPSWDAVQDGIKYAWAIAAHAVLSRAMVMQDHEAAVMRVIAEPTATTGDEPPPLLPPPPMK